LILAALDDTFLPAMPPAIEARQASSGIRRDHGSRYEFANVLVAPVIENDGNF
jgi:hypothetical protein